MTKEETKEAIKVMQACVDGKGIEFASRGCNNDYWTGLTTLPISWNWTDCRYRIVKPKPVELKVGMQLDRKEGVTLAIRKIIAINNGNCFYSVNCHSYISTIAEMIDVYVYLDDDGVRHELISPEPF